MPVVAGRKSRIESFAGDQINYQLGLAGLSRAPSCRVEADCMGHVLNFLLGHQCFSSTWW